MFAIIGIVVVFGAVAGGYLMEHGNLRVLVQPAELLIIAGAGIGTLLIANPLHILKSIGGALPAILKGSKFTKSWYLDSLKMMYELFGRARRDGLVALESDTDDPEKSQIFSKYPEFLKDHHILCFVCDTMRLVASNAVEAFELDQMVELDMDVHHHGATEPVSALSTMADSLPGLGIVAAVLGVVITMGVWAARRRRSGTKLPPPWWARSWGFSSATGWWARSLPIWRKPRMKSTLIFMSYGWPWRHSSKALRRLWPWRWRAGPFLATFAPHFRNSKVTAAAAMRPRRRKPRLNGESSEHW